MTALLVFVAAWFATAGPPPLAPTRGVRVVILSDLNSSYGSVTYRPDVPAASRAAIERLRPDVVLITGDMVAGQKRGLDYPAMWRAFHSAVTNPLLRGGIPVAPAPGNHDAAPGFEQERAEYAAQWRDPARTPRVRFVDRTNYPFSYSFEVGEAFFVALDATSAGPLPAAQRAWLEAQLAATRAPVKIVYGHMPNHPFAQRREHDVLGDPALDAILERHGVAAYLSGHHHAYYPGVVGRVRHVSMPCLGSGARALIGEGERRGAGLVVLDLDARGVRALDALAAPGFRQVVVRSRLPARVVRGRHVVVRDDLAGMAPPALVQVERAGGPPAPAARAASQAARTTSSAAATRPPSAPPPSTRSSVAAP